MDDLIAKGLEIPPKLILAWVLNNLTPEYESFVSNTIQNIRLNEASMNIESIFSSLLDESRRLANMEDNQVLLANSKLGRKPIVAKPTTSNTSSNNHQVGKLLCGYCQKPGHLEANCWQKNPSKKPKHKPRLK